MSNVYSRHKVVFFFISAKFSFGLLDFHSRHQAYPPLLFLPIKFLIVIKPKLDVLDAIVYINGKQFIVLLACFLMRIALLLIKDQARPFVLYAVPFSPLYQPKDSMPTFPSESFVDRLLKGTE